MAEVVQSLMNQLQFNLYMSFEYCFYFCHTFSICDLLFPDDVSLGLPATYNMGI